MKKIILSFFVVILIVIVITSFIGKSNEQNESISLRLAWIPGVTFIGDYVAKEKGYWINQGLTVDIKAGGFEFDAIKLVSTGVDSFGVTSGPQFLQAVSKGVPIIAIGATLPKSPIGWISKKESGIKTPYDFINKKIGAQYGTHTEVTFEALASKLNLDLKKIKRKPVKFDPKPFLIGDIDILPVYIIDQPIDISSKGIELNIIDPNDYGVGLDYGNIYFTSIKIFNENPELIKQFLSGANQGWMSAKSNPTEAVNILSMYLVKPNKEILNLKLQAMFDFIERHDKEFLGIYKFENKKWENIKDTLNKYNNQNIAVNIESIYTNKFLK